MPRESAANLTFDTSLPLLDWASLLILMIPEVPRIESWLAWHHFIRAENIHLWYSWLYIIIIFAWNCCFSCLQATVDCWPRLHANTSGHPGQGPGTQYQLARRQGTVIRDPGPRNVHPGSGSKERASGIRVHGKGIQDPGLYQEFSAALAEGLSPLFCQNPWHRLAPLWSTDVNAYVCR